MSVDPTAAKIIEEMLDLWTRKITNLGQDFAAAKDLYVQAANAFEKAGGGQRVFPPSDQEVGRC